MAELKLISNNEEIGALFFNGGSIDTATGMVTFKLNGKVVAKLKNTAIKIN